MRFNLDITNLAITDEHEQYEDTLHEEFEAIEIAHSNVEFNLEEFKDEIKGLNKTEVAKEYVYLRTNFKELIVALEAQLSLWKSDKALKECQNTDYIDNQITFSDNWSEEICCQLEDFEADTGEVLDFEVIDTAVNTGNWSNLDAFRAWHNTNYKSNCEDIYTTYYDSEYDNYSVWICESLCEIDENSALEDRLLKAIKYTQGKVIEINKILLPTHPEHVL